MRETSCSWGPGPGRGRRAREWEEGTQNAPLHGCRFPGQETRGRDPMGHLHVRAGQEVGEGPFRLGIQKGDKQKTNRPER